MDANAPREADTDDTPDATPSGQRGWSTRRRILTGTGVVAVAVVAYLGFSIWQVQHNLTAARDNALLAKDSLLAGDPEAAENAAAEANDRAVSGQGNLHSFPWSAVAAIPGVGTPFQSLQQMSDVVVGLTGDVLTPAVDVGVALSPEKLLSAGGKVELQPLRDAQPALQETSVAARALAEQSRDVQDAGYLGKVNDVRAQLQTQTDDIASLLENTALGAQVVPSMLGLDGPRSYFMAFQTNAEARGTGGLVGGYSVVRAVDGQLTVADLGQNTDVTFDKTPIDLGPDYDAMYGQYNPSTDIRNSNLSSHFPYAAQIWQSMWEQETGEKVDGAIATDPIALSYVLDAVGPITMPDGEVVDSSNVVELTLSTSYTRFITDEANYQTDNAERKAYLQTIAARVVAKMTAEIESPAKLLNAVGRAAGERRIAIWSSHPEEEAVLADTTLGYTVPEDDAPYAGVVINNNAGNKLDYYLEREIDYTAGECTADTRKSTVTVRLANNTPDADLPRIVAGTFKDRPLPYGTNLAIVSLLATNGATLTGVTIDGNLAFAVNGKELGHPIFSVPTLIPQGKDIELRFELTEPTTPGPARVPIQPLVDDPTVTVNVPSCGD